MDIQKGTSYSYKEYNKKLERTVIKMTEFLSNKNMNKLQKLKESLIYLNRKTNYNDQLATALLFKDKYQDYNVPIMPKHT